jgi:thiol-disulfide isomerase/thioredoxin
MRGLRTLLLGCLLLLTFNVAANEFVFKDMQGKVQRLSDYKGKWVLVNFWATWCPPCLEEIPDLVDMHNARSSSDFAVIGIAMSSSRESVFAFAKQLEISYPIVFGDDKSAAQIGRVEALPTSYLYDPTGKLVSYQSGMITREAIEAYIRSKTRKMQ